MIKSSSLAGIALALLLSLLTGGQSLAQSGLEALQQQLTGQIERRDYHGALATAQQIRTRAGQVPPATLYAEGFALLALGRPAEAERLLGDYLRGAQPGSQFYTELTELHNVAARSLPQGQGGDAAGRAPEPAPALPPPWAAAEDWPEDQPRPYDPEMLERVAPEVASEWELRARADAREWMRIRYSEDPEVFRGFLASYPDSRFAEPAARRYERLLSQLSARGHEAFQRGDYAEAQRLWLGAAEIGDSYAQTMLGLLHDRGLGVPEDPVQAREWFLRAAEQGEAAAQINLGVLYYEGRGVAQDSRQALEWLGRAADQGEAEALYRIGVVYQYGKGNVPQDLDQALYWFRQAAERGSEAARQEIAILGG